MNRGGFTLVELLVVVGVVSILASIAVPNFMEAQTRAKVARVEADLRSLDTALETFRVDNNHYPPCAGIYIGYPQRYLEVLGALAPGFCTFQTEKRSCSSPVNEEIAGIDFNTITTPIAYISTIPSDPFAQQLGQTLPYAYRNTDFVWGPFQYPAMGWIVTSAGPDVDLLAPGGCGSLDITNPLSTDYPGSYCFDICDPRLFCKALADINEYEVVRFIVGRPKDGSLRQLPYFRKYLARLQYDPSNGTYSDGDLYRVKF